MVRPIRTTALLFGGLFPTAPPAFAADRSTEGDSLLLIVPLLLLILIPLGVITSLVKRRPPLPTSPLLEHHPDLYLVTDAEGRWEEANHALLRLTGLTGRAWRGKGGDELAALAPLLADAASPLVRFGERLTADGEERAEFIVENHHGERVVYETIRIPRTDERGSVVGTLLIGRDITARRRASRIDRRFRDAVEGSQTIFFFLRPRDRTILYGNQSGAAIVDLPQERLIGMGVETLFPDLDEPNIDAHLSRMSDGNEEAYYFETLLMRADGRLVPVEVAVERVAREGEEPFFSLACWDLTAQRRADKALRTVMGGIARETGDHFFRSLAPALLSDLNLTGVGVARIDEASPDSAVTMVLSGREGILPPWSGPLEHLAASPCVTRREVMNFDKALLGACQDEPLNATHPEGIRGVPLFNVKGKVIGLFWVGYTGQGERPDVEDDILDLFAIRIGAELERLDAAAALSRSEEKYRKLFEWREWILEHSPEGIVHLDADLRIQFMSPAMSRILGAPASGSVVIGKRVDEIPPMVASGLAAALGELPKGKEVAIDQEYTSLYGKTVYLSQKGTPIFEEGRFAGAVLMVTDVTDIRKTTEALSRSERFLIQAQKFAHLGSFEWDYATGEVRYSDELFRILGYEPGGVVPSPASFLDAVHPDDAPALDQLRKEDLLHHHRFSNTTYRVVHPDGDIRHIMSRAEYTYDERGNPTRMIGTLHDITDNQQMQEALHRAQKLESLGLMAGGVAHDFNNLLVGIIGNISLALEDIAPDDPAHEAVSRSLSSAKRAADLANQMLAYSGKGGGPPVPVSLPPIIEELADLLTAGLPKRVTVEYHLAPDTPLTMGDETQLRQVVTNLIMNGAEAIGENNGRVTVSTGAVTLTTPPAGFRFGGEAPPPGEYLFVTVEDDGCGMNQEMLDRIFDPFFTTKFTGRGLGLASILGIVGMNKGYLGVRSLLSHGSTFTVWLPQAPCHAVWRPSPSEGKRPDNKEWKTGGVALVVDDEETVRHVAGRILTKAGFTVDTAVDGIEGLERYRANPDRYRLMIIDMTMPRMDGLTLLRELRKEGCRLPALISSGYDNQRAGTAFQGLEPLSLMRKPYTKGEFLQEVGALLRDHEER